MQAKDICVDRDDIPRARESNQAVSIETSQRARHTVDDDHDLVATSSLVDGKISHSHAAKRGSDRSIGELGVLLLLERESQTLSDEQRTCGQHQHS